MRRESQRGARFKGKETRPGSAFGRNGRSVEMAVGSFRTESVADDGFVCLAFVSRSRM